MVVEYQTIEKLLDYLKRVLNEINDMDFGLDELLENVDIQRLIERRLQLAIETCIDIASHLAAALSLPGRDTTADVFELLGKHGVIPNKLAEKFSSEVVGFRNILIHQYRDIDYQIVFKSYKEDLKDIREFAKAVVAFLEKNPQLVEK